MDDATSHRFAQAQIAYMPKIRTQARRTLGTIPGLDLDDLVSELLEVLWVCVRSYDPDKGATFNTLFWRSAHNHLKTLHRFASAQKRRAEWVFLSDEDVARAVDLELSEDSAEDYAIAMFEIRSRGNALLSA